MSYDGGREGARQKEGGGVEVVQVERGGEGDWDFGIPISPFPFLKDDLKIKYNKNDFDT